MKKEALIAISFIVLTVVFLLVNTNNKNTGKLNGTIWYSIDERYSEVQRIDPSYTLALRFWEDSLTIVNINTLERYSVTCFLEDSIVYRKFKESVNYKEEIAAVQNGMIHFQFGRDVVKFEKIPIEEIKKAREKSKFYSIEIEPNKVYEDTILNCLLELLSEYDELPNNKFNLSFTSSFYYYPSTKKEMTYNYVYEIKDIVVNDSNNIYEYDYIRGRLGSKFIAKENIQIDFIWEGDSLIKSTSKLN